MSGVFTGKISNRALAVLAERQRGQQAYFDSLQDYLAPEDYGGEPSYINTSRENVDA